MTHAQLRRHPLRTALWLWLVVAVFLLKAATPLLALAAANARGVALAEVCSVYGVRMVAVEVAVESSPGDMPTTPHDGGQAHCVLSTVLHSVPLATLPAAVWLHAPAPQPVSRQVAARPAPADARQRWLAAQLHAPPLSI